MIVVLGDIAVDVVSTLRTPLMPGSDAPARVEIMPGGSGANVAAWLGRLGLAVTFIGRVGDDHFGRWLADDLTAEGVRPGLIVDRRRRTGIIQVLVEPGGERTMVPDRGANAVWQPDEINEALIAQASLLHIVGYVLLDAASQPGALAAMAYARRHGVPISVDPSSHAPLRNLGAAAFWELVGWVDYLLPNRTEAQALTGHAAVEDALAELCARVGIVVIKLDRDGCIAASGAERARAAAATVPIVNATGAGDAFAAAFLATHLSGAGLTAACRAGAALGTFAATLVTTR